MTLLPVPTVLADRVVAEDRGHSTPCWIWKGVIGTHGYGAVYIKPMTRPGPLLVHRVAYELCVGPIPAGLTIDHLCRVRACCNPDHMEPVTRGENTLRGATITARNAAKTHCDHGHPFSADNTRITTEGHRECKECRRQISRRHYARLTAERTAA